MCQAVALGGICLLHHSPGTQLQPHLDQHLNALGMELLGIVIDAMDFLAKRQVFLLEGAHIGGKTALQGPQELLLMISG